MTLVFFDANALYDGATKAIKGSKFKHTTQLFRINQLLETAKLQRDLIAGTYTPKPGYKFMISERGHLRYITSIVARDKTLNHVICDEVLTPYLDRFLIYDNGASQKGKGISFTRRRLEIHLHEYFLEHGTNEGWIRISDYSGYYGNIAHDMALDKIVDLLQEAGADKETMGATMQLLRMVFKTYELDVSRFTDEEIEVMKTIKIDPTINIGVDPSLLTGEKMLRKGVDIGAQPSQNIGIVYPYRIDNLAKIVLREHRYARYTDDSYAIEPSKEKLKADYELMKAEAEQEGLIVNERKTRIVKISKPFRFMQIRYQLMPTGKLLRKISPKAITRERRKIKKYKKLLDTGRISYPDIENAFKSWLGGNYKYMSHAQIYNMATLYFNLFQRRPKWKKGKSRLYWLMTHDSRDSHKTGTTLLARPR